MKSVFKTIVLLTASMALFVACNKKSDGGTQAQQPIVQNCVMGQAVPAGYVCINGQLIANGGVNGGNLINNVQFQETNYFTGTVSISALNNSGVIYDMNDTRAFTRYSGQASVTGTMQITNNIPCGVPAGSYSINGTMNMSMGILSGGTLTLSGPTGAQWQIGSAFIYANNGYPELNGSANRLQIGYSFINGCGNFQTY